MGARMCLLLHARTRMHGAPGLPLTFASRAPLAPRPQLSRQVDDVGRKVDFELNLGYPGE